MSRFLARAATLASIAFFVTACGGYGGGDYSAPGGGGGGGPVLLMGAALSGASETTVVSASAKGTTLLEVRDDGTVQFAVTVESSWLGTITGARIQKANPGLDGPVVIDLLGGGATFDPVTRTASGTLTVTTALAVDMINYPVYYYANVTTATAPNGLVRGQLTPSTAMQVHAALNGSEESPVVDANARGAATFAIGTDRTAHAVLATGSPAIATVLSGKIHRGGAGVTGPVELDLGTISMTTNLTAGTLTGDGVIPVALLCRMIDNLAGFYVNLTTGTAPAGIVRGQLDTSPVMLSATLTGSAEIPVVSAGARGGMTLDLASFTAGRAIYAVPTNQAAPASISDVTTAQIEVGGLATYGPAVVDLRAGADFATTPATANAEGAVTLTQDLYTRLLGNPGGFYVNLRTAAAPGGLVRGQLDFRPLTFRAVMLGTLETPTLPDTSGNGAMKVIATGVNHLTFDVTMTTPAATTLIGAHVHEGAAGINGPIRIDLSGGTNVSVSATHLTGDATIPGRTLASLIAAPDLWYGNVHTAIAPNGVARGQFLRVTDTAAPTALVYSAPVVTYVTLAPITPNTPTNGGGAVANYSVAPALPAGLSLSTTTGIISGTPTTPTAAAGYVVTATNTLGSTTATVTITVNAAPPTNLTYTSPVTYVAGTAITPNTPTSSGGPVVSYSVLPALPTGLTLNTSTGVISGTPASATAANNYVVTATNTGGFTTASVNITVNSSLTAPAGLSYSTPTPSYPTGYAITANTPTSTGGPIASYGVSPALPAGLTLNTSSGVISGTPTTVTGSTAYTVTGTNALGSTTATVMITVTLGAPTALTYAQSPGVGYVTPASFTTMTPSSQGGAVASYALTGTLPAGLTFNTTTGVVSGTPTATSAYTAYTVTATNATGSTSTTIYIVVY